MSDRISRRRLLTTAGAMGAGLALSRFGFSQESPAPATQDFKGQTLRVFIYSGNWEKVMRESFVPKFQAKTGCRVIVDPGWWDSIPKLKASPPGAPCFDLVLTDATQGFPAIKEGMFQKIDMKRLPAIKEMDQSVLDSWVVKDGYGITFPESAMTLGYNKSMIDFEPKGWGDLMRDGVKGKLGIYNSFYMSLYTFACMKVATEKRAGQALAEVDKNLPGVIEFAKANRDRVKYWWPTSTDMAMNLAQKNCAIGNMHLPDMMTALKEKPELGALVPAEDRAYVLLMWVVPTGTKVKELAEEAMDFLLGEEMQLAFTRRGSVTSHRKVAAKVAAEDPFWAGIYQANETNGIHYYPYDSYFKDWDHLVEVWDKEILRKA